MRSFPGALFVALVTLLPTAAYAQGSIAGAVQPEDRYTSHAL